MEWAPTLVLVCLLLLLLLLLVLGTLLVAIVRLAGAAAELRPAELGALLGVLGLLLIFLPLIGMLSIPSTSSKFAPMLESKPSTAAVVSLLSFFSSPAASDFDLDLCFLFLGWSPSGRSGVRVRFDDFDEDEEADLCLSDLTLVT